MSKRGYISRYLLIVKLLKAKPYSSYGALRKYIDNNETLQEEDETLGFSVRTLQRDVRDISNLWGIDIEYSKKQKGYFISNSNRDNMNFQRMAESFDMFNSLNLAHGVASYIHLEKRPPQSTENLHGLLHAIKKRLKVRFLYQKFWEGEITQRSVAPYALKEFGNRWYVLSRDDKDGKVKSFALDPRMSDFEVTNIKFEIPTDYNVEESYRHCFGIIGPDDKGPQEVILSFEYEQGRYVKTLPLHESQVILTDGTELQIKLNIYLTHDFKMQLLSYGSDVKVLKPESLAKEIKEAHQEAFMQY